MLQALDLGTRLREEPRLVAQRSLNMLALPRAKRRLGWRRSARAFSKHRAEHAQLMLETQQTLARTALEFGAHARKLVKPAALVHGQLWLVLVHQVLEQRIESLQRDPLRLFDTLHTHGDRLAVAKLVDARRSRT